MFWLSAALTHFFFHYGKEKDNILIWSVEILVAAIFATGFGWYLHSLVTLKRLEKRGTPGFKSRFFSKKFGKV